MLSENSFKNLNIKGENILKNENNNTVTNSSYYYDNINNLVINSNLDNTNLIK